MRSPLDRTFDACLNRASEGLRVLMDAARFELDDAEISERLKSVRHRLIRLFHPESGAGQNIVFSRDSPTDVGRPAENSPPPSPHRTLSALVEANARRVEEGLRSLEEFSRIDDSRRAREIERLRYECYDLHLRLAERARGLIQESRMDFELYVVTDERLSRGRPIGEIVRKAVAGGAGCIQLREKHLDKRAILSRARELSEICRGEGATFIINDHLDVALDVGADGVHLGQEDFPLESARRISLGRLILGISTHNREQALEAQAGGAGYINLGPIFPTETKGTPVHPVTPALIREVRPLLHIPFTTMGGIHLENVEEVILAGADRVAVVSEVVAAEDVEGAARRMVGAIRRAKEKRRGIESKDS